MAYNWAFFYADVEAVVVATWTDVSAILRHEQAARRSYEGITLPYATIERNTVEAGDWGVVNQAWEPLLVIHYIRKWSDTAEDAVDAKLEALRDALEAASFTTSGASLLEVAINTGVDHPANGIIVGKNIPLIGGSLSARFVCGETIF